MRTYIKFVVSVGAICILCSIAISVILLMAIIGLTILIARSVLPHIKSHAMRSGQKKNSPTTVLARTDANLAETLSPGFSWQPLPPENSTEAWQQSPIENSHGTF